MEQSFDASASRPSRLGSNEAPVQRQHPYLRPPTLLRSASLGTLTLSAEDLESAQCSSETHTQARRATPPKLGDYSPQEAVMIQAAQRRVVLDMITTKGWIKNATKAERTKMHSYAREVVNSLKPRYDGGADFLVTSDVTTLVIQALTKDRSRLAATAEKSIHHYYKYLKPQDDSLSSEECKAHMNMGKNLIHDSSQLHTYFLHGHLNGRLVMFAADAVQDTFIRHYFVDELSPLYDEFLRKLLTKGELRMLSMVAVGVECSIDRFVEGRMSGSGNVLRFSNNQYCERQHTIHRHMMLAYGMPIHKESLQAFLHDLSDRGMSVLQGRLGLISPSDIYIPTTMGEVVLPEVTDSNTSQCSTAIEAPDSLHPMEATGCDTWSSCSQDVSVAGGSGSTAAAVLSDMEAAERFFTEFNTSFQEDLSASGFQMGFDSTQSGVNWEGANTSDSF